MSHLSSLNTTNTIRFVGWPPLVIALGLVSGVSWATIVYNVALTWVWVASWLSGALVKTNYKWGFFAFGTVAEILLATSLLHIGTLSARRVGVGRHYVALSSWLVFLWALYPVAYGVDDGGNEIKVVSGWIFFGVLDLLSGPLTGLAILGLSTQWDFGALNIYFTQYGRLAPGTHPEREKAPARIQDPVVGSRESV